MHEPQGGTVALLGVFQRQGLGWVPRIREECTEPGSLCPPEPRAPFSAVVEQEGERVALTLVAGRVLPPQERGDSRGLGRREYFWASLRCNLN